MGAEYKQLIKPTLCKLCTKPFDDPNWIWERKYDGVRIIAHIGSTVKLQARSGSDKTLVFPDIDIQTTLPSIIDGEVISAHGLSFQDGIQPRVNRQEDIANMARKLPAKFIAFDILELEGKSLAMCPLSERKTILESVLITTSTSEVIDYSTSGTFMYHLAEEQGWEGIVGKDMNGIYEEGKRRWLKVKVWQYGEFWAVGFTNGTGKREGYIGALTLEDKAGIYVGEVGTGFTDHELSTFTSDIKERMARESITKIKVLIKYQERTSAGKLRFPVYMGRLSG